AVAALDALAHVGKRVEEVGAKVATLGRAILVPQTPHRRGDERLLGRVAPVDRAAGDLGLGGHRLHGRVGDAALRHQTASTVEDDPVDLGTAWAAWGPTGDWGDDAHGFTLKDTRLFCIVNDLSPYASRRGAP